MAKPNQTDEARINRLASMTRLPAETESMTADPEARSFEGRSRLKTAAEIRLDRIVADPNQPRVEFDPESLSRLASSLKQRGQLQPIRVRWDEALDRYVVVVGERRWRAARLAGLTAIACVVASGNAAPEEILEDQLIENCLREDLRPIEQAKAFRTLLSRLGISQRQLAERLQVSPPTITRALALLELPDSIQTSVDAGEIAPHTAYEISKIDDTATQVEVAAQAAQGRLRRDDMREMVTRTPRQSRGTTPKPWVHNIDGRVRVTLAPLADDVGHEELVEALRSALATLRKKSRGQAA
ncbi:ParB/RepB/Spo0J family partition protein [Singulisphaera acidiphila]|uniref:ParB-like partition protein n=1 Tax=Singulisphaera acidiphila (strain ATCC BAA-1392 / DSM 18658 / VKM B-2454 / MOB10) TaxID=886293 RepID=L0DTB4_SINAD|nr:ParB/RepB/Spo0J family partition protein [Singulisphaera acidiphila]AGA31606.1 ParB-like partition protein [Singulisphaera acidiphila DSM 18658]